MVYFRRKLYSLLSIIFLFLITVYLFFEMGEKIANGFRNNITNLAIRSRYISLDADCEKIDLSNSDGYPNLAEWGSSTSFLSQARWIQILGYTNRSKLLSFLKSNEVNYSENSSSVIKELLFPRPWAMSYDWHADRCQAAWGSWTLGLFAAAKEDWAKAVAYYQAGIGLAPGNVPREVINEYYRALAQQRMANGKVSLEDQVAAGKYFALGGDNGQAKTLFQSLQNKSDLSPSSNCEVELALDWLQETVSAESPDLPPWPTNQDCSAALGLDRKNTKGWLPGWVLSKDGSIFSDKAGNELIGFDLDADVLEAGVEVLGILYWQTPAGDLLSQRFRQPNLWPNSGNSWLGLPGFSGCIPGYGQPSWVPGCASQVIKLQDEAGETILVGELRQPAELEPDSLINTASVKLGKNLPMIYGGRFLVNGDFPRGHTALVLLENTSESYQPLLDLSRLSPGQWFSISKIVNVPVGESEYSQWIRPRAGVGSGKLLFDDLFGFTLPDMIYE